MPQSIRHMGSQPESAYWPPGPLRWVTGAVGSGVVLRGVEGDGDQFVQTGTSGLICAAGWERAMCSRLLVPALLLG